MANLNQPFGFRPIRPLAGGIERPNKYTIADGYNTAIYFGQPVVLTGTGRNIAVGAGTAEILAGIFAGCEYVPLAGDQHPVFSKHWPASTAIAAGTEAVAFVYDDPLMAFVAQANGSLAAADVGLNADYVAGTGSAVTGYAGSAINVTGKNTTATLMFRILGLFDDPGKNAWGDYARVVCRMNVCTLGSATGQ